MKLSTADKIKMTLLCFLIPIRLLLLALAFLLAGLISKVLLIGNKESDPAVPVTGFKRVGQRCIWMIARCCAFICGYHHIRIKGKMEEGGAPVVVVAPHSSFIDAFLLGMLGRISVVSRVENTEVPVIGNCVRLLQPALVSRNKKNSRLFVVKEIKRRATEGNWPPIVIFPEGTCTNRECFITFKPGAFYPGEAVQPVLLRYTDKLNFATWTWDGLGVLPLLCIMMSRLNNNMEVEILPVYRPSEEEKSDAFLYSRNVREYMAKVASIPVTDHSYEDCRLMMEAKKLNLPMEAGLVEYYKLSPMVGMNCDCMIEYLHKFAKIDTSCDGVIDLQEFCDYLNLPATDEVKTIYRIYDIDKSQTIQFREYLLGFFLISRPFNTDENISSAFSLFDEAESGYITLDEFSILLKRVLQLDDVYINKMFQDLDSQKTGKVEFDEFKEFCLAKPEYALLFIHFRKLQQETSSMTFSRTELQSTGSISEFQMSLPNYMPEVSV